MGGRWERVSGWGTHVSPWQIHVNVWQSQYNIVKYQPPVKINKFKKTYIFKVNEPTESKQRIMVDLLLKNCQTLRFKRQSQRNLKEKGKHKRMRQDQLQANGHLYMLPDNKKKPAKFLPACSFIPYTQSSITANLWIKGEVVKQPQIRGMEQYTCINVLLRKSWRGYCSEMRE